MGIDTSVLVTRERRPRSRWPTCCWPRSRAPPRPTWSTARSTSGSRAPPACCPRWCTLAEKHGFEVTDLSATEPTLETVFIKLTGKDLRE